MLIEGVNAVDLDGDGLAELFGRSGFVRNRLLAPGQTGYREQYGSGTPGVGGIAPTLGASGPFQYGETASLNFTGAEGGAITFLKVGVNPTNLVDFPAVGLAVYTYPWAITKKIVVNGPFEVAGAGYKQINYTVSTLPPGLPLYFQYFVFESQGGLTQSNGLELVHSL